ncbi:MAG: hypothetical protein AAF494_03895 [Pseudomonadota bacterium]
MTEVILSRDALDKLAAYSSASQAERFSPGRRSLVLTDERANHPFRASLPPNVRQDLHEIPAEKLWRLTKEDVRGVASTYVAATAAILAFIL